MKFLTLALINVLILFLNFDSYGSYTRDDPQLPTVIKELNQRLRIHWNLCVALEPNEELNRLFRDIEIPKMFLTNSNITPSDSNKFHHRQLMVIALVQKKPYDDMGHEQSVREVVNIIKQFLHRAYNTQILWIYENANFEDLEKLSQTNWHNGFMNCLYYVNASLYTYEPVPSVKVQHVQDVQQYCNRKPIKDFQGHPLTFPITCSAPRCYHYKDRKDNIVYAGVYCKILKIFMDVYKFQFVQFPISYCAFEPETLFQAVLNKEIDFLTGPLYGSIDLDKSDVMWNNYAYLLVPSPKPISKDCYYFLPFSRMVWTIHTLTYVVASCLVAISTYAERTSANQLDIHKPFLFVFSVFLNQSPLHHIRPQRRVQKFMFLLLMLHGFLTTQFYLARLSSALVSITYEPEIKNFEEFAQTDLKLLVMEEDDSHIRSLPEIPYFILDRIEVANSKRQYLRSFWHLNVSHAYVVPGDVSNFLLFQQKFLKYPRMHKIKTFLFSLQMYFTIRKDLPYLHIFNQFLHNLAASGIYHQIMQEVNQDGILTGKIHFFQDHEAEMPGAPLGIEYFVKTFEYFCCGLLISFLVFAGEIGYKKYWKTK